jgi:SAM-dependent methyltransferase
LFFVDDGSQDDTWTLIEKAHADNPKCVRGLKFSRNVGHQNALLAGLLGQIGRADAVISLDADYGYFGRYRSNIVKRLSGFNVANILDFGCEVGLGIRPLREAFSECRIVGCDPSQESLTLARASEPDCEFMESSAIEPKPQFDIVTTVSVFHHIVPSDRDAALRYCFERLKPGGHLFVFEHNPYNPLTRHLVSRCPVDRDAILLKPKETVARFMRAGFDRVAAEYCLFFFSQGINLPASARDFARLVAAGWSVLRLRYSPVTGI